MYNKIVKNTATKLTGAQVTEKLVLLNSALKNQEPAGSWRVEKHNNLVSIRKQFVLKNFETTSSFINQINMRSHLLGHHPTVLYTYNKVDIILQTHDVGGVSDVDFLLAKKISSYAKNYE